MHFDFRPLLCKTFRELSRNSITRRPSHQQAAHQRKSKHQGRWCLALAEPHFWKLGCCIWNLFLETSESNVISTSGRCKDLPQDHVVWLWRSLTLGSLVATYEGKSKCAVPFSCRTPGRPGRQELVALNKL